MNIEVSILEKALTECWIKETSNQPEKWASSNPTLGQCAVTALLVNEMFGGVIIRGEFKNGQTHYWNLIEKNVVDLTRDQFKGEVSFERISLAAVDKMMSNENTANRFNILKKKVKKILETGNNEANSKNSTKRKNKVSEKVEEITM